MRILIKSLGCFFLLAFISSCEAEVLSLNSKEDVESAIKLKSQTSEKGSIVTKEVVDATIKQSREDVVWSIWRGYSILHKNGVSIQNYIELAQNNLALYHDINKTSVQDDGGGSQLFFLFAPLKDAIHVFNRYCISNAKVVTENEHLLLIHQEVRDKNVLCTDFVVLLSFNGLELQFDDVKSRLIIKEQRL